MSVYTFLNQKQIGELLSLYGIQDLEHYQEITDGIENSNYLIRADGQEFVLTIFEQITADTLSACFDFMTSACKKGFSLPAPLQNQEGQMLSFFMQGEQGAKKTKRHFILCPRLAGSHPDNITSQLCEHLGEQLGLLHKLSLDEPMPNGFVESDLSFVIPEFNGMDHAALSFLSKEKQKVFDQEIERIKQLNKLFSDLPKGICHCDFFPDNALVSSNLISGNLVSGSNEQQYISGFLDWYDARHIAFIYDLAVVCISWCSMTSCHDLKFELNQEKQKALLKGYEKSRPLNKVEKLQWKDYLCIAAFKFWIHREIYHHNMRSNNMAEKINAKKSPEEFWQLLGYLKQC